jgi:AraC-like DNA-binding protein
MEQPVIDPNAGKSDPEVGDYARLLRSPDVRFANLNWESWKGEGPFLLNFTDTGRAYFYYVKRGAAFIRTGPEKDDLQYVSAGTAVAVEGRAHQLMDRSHATQDVMFRPESGVATGSESPVEIVLSSVDRRTAVLQRLKHGAIIIPPTAKPHADMIRSCVDLVDRNQRKKNPDLGITRRLAEVIMLELVAFARSQTIPLRSIAGAALHDEYLLRALSAFFATPSANWTVLALAEVAGISRTAFVDRFRKAFNEPPLRMINRIRLGLAAEMLLSSRAPLGEIAEAIGFGSSAAFVRAFKKQFHQTPNAWRGLDAFKRETLFSELGL